MRNWWNYSAQDKTEKLGKKLEGVYKTVDVLLVYTYYLYTENCITVQNLCDSFSQKCMYINIFL